jgi:hypothetical protein
MRTPLHIIESLVNGDSGYVQRRGVDAGELAPSIAWFRSIQAEQASANADEHLSEAGKRFRIEQAQQKVTERDLPAFEAGTLRLIEQRDAAEAEAMRTPAVDASRAAEIRGWLEKKSQEERIREYYAAIGTGDWETVDAIERAPSSMNFLDEQTRAKGRERILAKASPQVRATIDRLNNRIAAREHVAFTARELLKEMAAAAAADASIGGRR